MARNERQRERQRARNRIYKQKKRIEQEAALQSCRGHPRDPRLKPRSAQQPREVASPRHHGETDRSHRTPPRTAEAPKPAWDATPDQDSFDKLVEDISNYINSPSSKPQPVEADAPVIDLPITTSESAASSESLCDSSTSSDSSSEDEVVDEDATSREARPATATFERLRRPEPWATNPTARRPTEPAKWNPAWGPAKVQLSPRRALPARSREINLERYERVKRNLLAKFSEKELPKSVGHYTTNDDPSRKRKRRASQQPRKRKRSPKRPY